MNILEYFEHGISKLKLILKQFFSNLRFFIQNMYSDFLQMGKEPNSHYKNC